MSRLASDRLTEVSDKERLGGIGCPFAVDNVVFGIDVQSKRFGALDSFASVPAQALGAGWRPKLTLLNFSRPPSLSLIVLIHS